MLSRIKGEPCTSSSLPSALPRLPTDRQRHAPRQNHALRLTAVDHLRVPVVRLLRAGVVLQIAREFVDVLLRHADTAVRCGGPEGVLGVGAVYVVVGLLKK